MPRQPRLEYEGARYHVTVRGNGRERIFFGPDDYERFLRQLKDNLQTFDVILYAYVLMHNHYHLLVRTKRPNLCRFMQRLNTSYALYARYKHEKPGHQLEGRYKAKIVGDDEYVVTLTRYIHLNPVKTERWTRVSEEERLQRLESYPWSSYPGYVRKSCVEDWMCYEVLNYFGGTNAAARRRYGKYVRLFVTESDEQLLGAIRESSYAIGSEDYIQEVEEKLRSKARSVPQDKDVSLPRPDVKLEIIDEAVASEFGIGSENLGKHGHTLGVMTAKVVAVELACRLTALNQRQIGTHYGGISSPAVSKIRKRAKEESTVAAHLARLLTELSRVGK